MKALERITKKGIFTISLGVIIFTSQAFAQGTWEIKAPMPLGVVYAMSGVINGQFYVVGGQPPTGYTTTKLQVYDPTNNTWMTKSPALTSRSNAATGVIGGKLYVVGGAINGDFNNTTNILEVYDPVTNTWQTKSPMPTPRNTMAAGVIDGKLYVVGGMKNCGPCTPLSTNEVYDPVTNTWQTRAAMPTPRRSLGAVVIDGKLYVVGGINPHPYPIATLEVYDPVTNSWDTTAPPMPTALYLFGVGVINGLLHVVGGSDGSVNVSTHEVYNPSTKNWTSDAPMLTTRAAHVMEAINSHLYVAGGIRSGVWGTNVLEVYTSTVVNNPPIAVCKDVALVADEDCCVTVSAGDVDGGSSDPDGNPITLSVSPTEVCGIGNYTVTLTVSDGNLESTCNATVTVIDATAPVIACPADVELVINSISCAKIGNIGSASATDNCDDAPVVTDDAATAIGAGSGIYTVTWKATDVSGNVATCTQSVTVTVNTSAICEEVIALIAGENCPPGAGWINHGKYVSCVAHAANNILGAMLIENGGCLTPEEYDEIHSCVVSNAAKTDIGKRIK